MSASGHRRQAARGRYSRCDRHGRAAVHAAARRPSVVQDGVARRQRALGRAHLPRGDEVAPVDASARRRPRHERGRVHAGTRAADYVLGARRRGRQGHRARLCRRRSHRRQQRPQLPHVRRRPAAHSRSQRRSPRAHRAPAPRARLDAAPSSRTRTVRPSSCHGAGAAAPGSACRA